MNEIDANAKIIFFGVTRFDERERFFFFYRNRLYYESGAKGLPRMPPGSIDVIE